MISTCNLWLEIGHAVYALYSLFSDITAHGGKKRPILLPSLVMK